MNIDRLEWLLDNWSVWMKRPTHKLGYPAKSLCISSGGASGIDEFEIMCEEMDTTNAIKIDALIDSLRPPQQVAINHIWLKVLHCYPTQEIDYEDGIVALLNLCKKRGIV